MKVVNLFLLAMFVALPFHMQGEPINVQGETTNENAEGSQKGQRLKEILKNINPAYQAKSKQSDAGDSARKNSDTLTPKQVKGVYVTEGFTNTLSCDCTEEDFPFSSIASIGQLVLKGNGTGYFPFLAITAAFNDCFGETFTFNDVKVTYTLDPDVCGVGEITLVDFPGTGSYVSLYVVFKVKDGKVVGFNQLLNNTSFDYFPLWFLGEGVKNSYKKHKSHD